MALRTTLTERSVPEKFQTSMRLRLRSLRISRNIVRSTANITGVSANTLACFENVDISLLNLQQMYALANKYGMSFEEFLAYLFNFADDALATLNSSELVLMSAFRALDSRQQNAVLNLTHNLSHG